MKPWACIARLGGCGDNLIASSVLPLLAEDYNVEVICQDPYHVVFENNPYIAKLSVHGKDDIPVGEEWNKWFTIRAKEYERFVNLSHSCETMLVLTKNQTQFYWPVKWQREFCGKSYVEFVHDIVGVPRKINPQFFPTNEESTRAVDFKQRIGGKYIAWVMSGSRIDKRYPYMAQVIARLIKELDVPVLMMGAPGVDKAIAERVGDLVLHQNGNHDKFMLALSNTHATTADSKVPDWPLRRIITQAQHADLVIGPDTGPMWGVAMEQVPKVMLLSHASPENITKGWVNTVTLHADPVSVPCWPCHKLHDGPETCVPNSDNTGAACISDINAEVIVAAARSVLQRSE